MTLYLDIITLKENIHILIKKLVVFIVPVFLFLDMQEIAVRSALSARKHSAVELLAVFVKVVYIVVLIHIFIVNKVCALFCYLACLVKVIVVILVLDDIAVFIVKMIHCTEGVFSVIIRVWLYLVVVIRHSLEVCRIEECILAVLFYPVEGSSREIRLYFAMEKPVIS